MIDVTVANFEAQVVAASMTTPVLLDFWAPWCGPCKSLGPVLEKIELAYGGRFVLAKVDSDQEQQLSAAFGVRSIPTCILMVNGEPVDGFTGALPEGEIKAFLDKHLPPAPAAEPEAPAPLTLAEMNPQDALAQLEASLQAEPTHQQHRFDYVKTLLLQGRTDDAKVAFAPVIAQTSGVRQFDSLQRWMNAIDFVAACAESAGAVADLDAKIAINKRDFEARFDKAQHLMAQHAWTQALDELLEILMRDKSWSEDRARKTYIAVLDVMQTPPPVVADGQIPPDNPVVATYRRRLSSVILS